jgi:hypothetical protein
MSDTDPTVSTSPSQAGKGDAETHGSTVNFEAKYRGEAKRNARIQKEHEALQNAYDELAAKAADLESKLRSATKDSEKALRDAEARATAAEKAKSDLEAQIQRINKQNETRQMLREKHPSLIEPFEAGDLKAETDFEKPEDWTAYLERMAKRFAAPTQTPEPQDTPPANPEMTDYEAFRQRRLSGVVPPAGTPSRDGSRARTLQEIQDDMWALDGTNPQNSKRLAELTDELNRALVRK